ncbi:hypothetical protein DYB35_008229 [Aphanomyces astaci]|uniref:Uncharacterized protein n=2 Tax=Aphanomyces astaci TaxID=112090 RepID=A0A3R7BGB3_APHAT|nr:hypothetical protein DYB35_008229 [Aphanomyces astaci]
MTSTEIDDFDDVLLRGTSPSYGHRCVWFLTTGFLEAAGRDASIAKLFLDAKFDVNARDEKGCMALHHAALRGQAENVRLLLTVHDPQDLQVTTADGDSVLYLACTSGNVDVVNLVMASSAHLHVDAANETPLMTAVIFESLEIVQRLVQAHADVTMKDSVRQITAQVSRGFYTWLL